MDDYIRRQDAVSRISDLLVFELKMTRCPTWNEVYNAIGKLPSADVVQVVHGEWIRTESFMNGIVTRIYKCSCCDGVAGVRADNGFWYKSNFCPNCGAKMDGGDEHG